MKKLTSTLLLLLLVVYSFAQTFTLNHNGTSRSYILHLPTGYSSSTKYPVVLSFHGLTSNASQQQMMTGLDGVSNSNKFIVVYPNGLNNSWNAGINNGTVDDIGFVNTLLDALIAKYSIDQQRIYSTGFSMGGYFSYRLACKLSNRIAAIAPVSGVMAYSTISGCTATRPVPVAHFHGTSDAIVSYSQVPAAINFWRNQNKCTAAAQITQISSNVKLTVYGGCAASSEVRLYEINGAGHTYPRASSSIAASQVMWDFFKRFTLSNQPSAGTSAPTVSITSPVNNATIQLPSIVTINATASDADGTISKVEFYQGSAKIGEDLTSPYSFSTGVLASGGYIFTAKAIDNSNLSATSAPINITIGTATNTTICSNIPSYSIYGNYVNGSIVKYRDSQYACKSASRCNGSAWAYAPGSGKYWEFAWTLKGACSSQSVAEAPIAESQLAAPSEMTISPNPVENQMIVSFTSSAPSQATISIYDMVSNPVYTKTVDAIEGINYMELDVTDIKSGFHLVRIQSLNETLSNRIYIK